MKNIREIAKLSGVSIATVSRYVNKTGNVSDSASKKIQTVIDLHGYVPNKLTSAIFNNDSKIVGLVVEDVSNPFFPELLDEIEHEITKIGYVLLVCNTQGNEEQERQYLSKLRELRVSGIIVVNTLNEELYNNLTIPIVSVERKIKNTSFVISDNVSGAVLAFNELRKSNRSKLAYVKNTTYNEASLIRLNTFQSKCVENSIDLEIISLDEGDLSKLKEKDGIFCWNDLTAHAIIKYLKRSGVSIPQDISIVGYDGIDVNNLFEYELTTIRQDLKQIGRESVSLLEESIKTKSVKDVIIPITLITGETV